MFDPRPHRIRRFRRSSESARPMPERADFADDLRERVEPLRRAIKRS